MNTAPAYLWFNTSSHQEFINIPDKLEELVSNSGIIEGSILVSIMHIPSGVYINDVDDGLITDTEE